MNVIANAAIKTFAYNKENRSKIAITRLADPSPCITLSRSLHRVRSSACPASSATRVPRCPAGDAPSSPTSALQQVHPDRLTQTRPNLCKCTHTQLHGTVKKRTHNVAKISRRLPPSKRDAFHRTYVYITFPWCIKKGHPTGCSIRKPCKM